MRTGGPTVCYGGCLNLSPFQRSVCNSSIQFLLGKDVFVWAINHNASLKPLRLQTDIDRFYSMWDYFQQPWYPTVTSNHIGFFVCVGLATAGLTPWPPPGGRLIHKRSRLRRIAVPNSNRPAKKHLRQVGSAFAAPQQNAATCKFTPVVARARFTSVKMSRFFFVFFSRFTCSDRVNRSS